MSLADELMADLEGSDEEEEAEVKKDEKEMALLIHNSQFFICHLSLSFFIVCIQVKEEEEEMDSEDIKPSKLELEQVFGIFGYLGSHYWLLEV